MKDVVGFRCAVTSVTCGSSIAANSNDRPTSRCRTPSQTNLICLYPCRAGLSASRAPCRPHASRAAALVMRRARRPCSAYTWEVCVTGKDIAPVAEQTLQHTSSSATNSARIIIVAQLLLGMGYGGRIGSECSVRERGKLFSHSPKRSLGRPKHRVDANNSNNRRVY